MRVVILPTTRPSRRLLRSRKVGDALSFYRLALSHFILASSGRGLPPWRLSYATSHTQVPGASEVTRGVARDNGNDNGSWFVPPHDELVCEKKSVLP